MGSCVVPGREAGVPDVLDARAGVRRVRVVRLGGWLVSAEVAASVAERYVLGALMVDPRVLRDVREVEGLIPRDFSDHRLGSIYSGIVRLVLEKEPADYIAVWDQLASWNVNGIELQEIAAWTTQVPTAANAGYYARIVRRASLRRSVASVASTLATADDPGLAIARGIDALRELRDRDAITVSAGVKMLREVLDVPENEDAYDWVVPGLIERRDRLVLTGSEGGGKSTFLRQIAVLSSAGIHPFRFSPIDPVRVLVVDAENSERQWRRAVRRMVDDAALRGNQDPRDSLALECLTKQIDITRAGDLGSIHQMVDAVQPDLLLIGPLYKLVPRSIKDDDDAAPVLAALDSLRDRNVAMLIEAHAGHASSASGERDLRPRGSSALLGWPEFGLGLRRDKQMENGRVSTSLVRWRGDRDVRAWPSKLARGQNWPWEPTVAL